MKKTITTGKENMYSLTSKEEKITIAATNVKGNRDIFDLLQSIENNSPFNIKNVLSFEANGIKWTVDAVREMYSGRWVVKCEQGIEYSAEYRPSPLIALFKVVDTAIAYSKTLPTEEQLEILDDIATRAKMDWFFLVEGPQGWAVHDLENDTILSLKEGVAQVLEGAIDVTDEEWSKLQSLLASFGFDKDLFD